MRTGEKGAPMPQSVFGNEFDRVVVINLDRRKDRMSTVREQLATLGVGYERHPASDGQSAEVAAEWLDYKRRPAAPFNDARSVANWKDFYLGDKPHEARVAFFEKERGRPAISTSGAWGLYRSMRRVIEKAVQARAESVLILEDDVLFHRDTADLWQKARAELPDDWQILQLGAMQLHWEDDWISWHSQHLYRCQGSSIAAHAVALKREAMLAVLARSETPDLPFDIGPLTEVKRLYRDRCFTVYPNIAIQDARDSEIGMSRMFAREAKKARNVYRWDWSAYGPKVLRSPETQHFSNGRPRASGNGSEAAESSFLQPYSVKPDSSERILVVFGPDDESTAEAYATMLKAQREKGAIAPIVVIDDLDHIPLLRSAGLAFEFVPTASAYANSLPPDRDHDLVIARRLSILRRKWRPRRIMAFGSDGQARLAAWRDSPFEKDAPGPDLASDASQADPTE